MSGVKERLWGAGEPVSGFLNLIPSPVATQAMASAGAEVVLVDQEHGPIGPESLHAMIAATAGTPCSPWVRVCAAEAGQVTIALDAGAEGIVFPHVTDADSAAACVALTRYPPRGIRGWGPFVAHSRWGVGLFDYLSERDGATICSLLVETRSAVENIEAICQVDGIDNLTIAPFDLSTELGVSGRLDAPELVEAVEHVERVVGEADIPLGGAALAPQATRALVEKGYRVLWHGFDVLVLKQFVQQATQWRGD